MCSGCGNTEAYQKRVVMGGYGCEEVCNKCGDLESKDAPVSDVFWNGKGYFSEALGVEFTSKLQKAQVMKERGVSELGSQKLGEKTWIEGSREFRKKQFEKERPKIRETYARYLAKARRK